MQTCLNAGKDCFDGRAVAMKHVQACFSARKDRESSFRHCESPVKLVQACVCAEKTWQSCFNRRRSAVKHLQACLSASKDRESSFHHCGGHVMPVQACLCA